MNRLGRSRVEVTRLALGTAGIGDLHTEVGEEEAHAAARSLPGLTFVLDHLGKPPVASGALEPWAGHLKALGALPNTVGKVSGLVTETDRASWGAAARSPAPLRPYWETALDAFGPGRLMFGSDWPVCTLAATYAQVSRLTSTLARDLGPEDRHRLFEATATRVYGL